MAPRDTPPAIIAKLNAATNAALQSRADEKRARQARRAAARRHAAGSRRSHPERTEEMDADRAGAQSEGELSDERTQTRHRGGLAGTSFSGADRAGIGADPRRARTSCRPIAACTPPRPKANTARSNAVATIGARIERRDSHSARRCMSPPSCANRTRRGH